MVFKVILSYFKSFQVNLRVESFKLNLSHLKLFMSCTRLIGVGLVFHYRTGQRAKSHCPIKTGTLGENRAKGSTHLAAALWRPMAVGSTFLARTKWLSPANSITIQHVSLPPPLSIRGHQSGGSDLVETWCGETIHQGNFKRGHTNISDHFNFAHEKSIICILDFKNYIKNFQNEKSQTSKPYGCFKKST